MTILNMGGIALLVDIPLSEPTHLYFFYGGNVCGFICYWKGTAVSLSFLNK